MFLSQYNYLSSLNASNTYFLGKHYVNSFCHLVTHPLNLVFSPNASTLGSSILELSASSFSLFYVPSSLSSSLSSSESVASEISTILTVSIPWALDGLAARGYSTFFSHILMATDQYTQMKLAHCLVLGSCVAISKHFHHFSSYQ